MSDYALIIVDMVKDNVNPGGRSMMDVEASAIIPPIRELSGTFRATGNRVVYACDSFMEGDFIFGGKMPPHAIRQTGGDEPLDELGRQPEDLFLPKRRFSAFYKTDLDQTLRLWGVHTVFVCGIVTNVCVLVTALDALQNDFRSVIVTDASACHKPEVHETTLDLYRPLILYPLFRLMSVSEVTAEVQGTP